MIELYLYNGWITSPSLMSDREYLTRARRDLKIMTRKNVVSGMEEIKSQILIISTLNHNRKSEKRFLINFRNR